jgi:hypothetical protein
MQEESKLTARNASHKHFIVKNEKQDSKNAIALQIQKVQAILQSLQMTNKAKRKISKKKPST